MAFGMRILVTGATGFVGAPLCRLLGARGHEVAAAVRRTGEAGVAVGDIGPDTDWAPALHGVETVIHLANRAHVMNDAEADPLAVFRRVNRDGTLRLAAQAVACGVRRLVFVSSIKVNGEATLPGRPFTAADTPAPADPYGVYKLEAERGLAELSARTGLEVTVVRPPLVYGPGGKGNLATLLRVLTLRLPLPLPLGAVDNRRSLLGLSNLLDLLALCATSPAAAGRTFLARDGLDLSTPDLLRRLGRALGRPVWLLPVPPPLLRAAGALTGKGAAVARLLGSLQVDDTETRTVLDWVPPVGVDAELAAMAATFSAERRR